MGSKYPGLTASCARKVEARFHSWIWSSSNLDTLPRISSLGLLTREMACHVEVLYARKQESNSQSTHQSVYQCTQLSAHHCASDKSPELSVRNIPNVDDSKDKTRCIGKPKHPSPEEEPAEAKTTGWVGASQRQKRRMVERKRADPELLSTF